MPAELEQAYLRAYDECADAIFRHCVLRIGDRELGKDLMQETYLRAWEYLCKGENVKNLRAFLYKVANNLIIDTYRKGRKQREESLEAMQEAGVDIPSADPGPLHRASQQEVIDTLQEIEEPYRTAVILRYIDGLPPREIAELLKISPNVVSVRIHRGLEKLMTLLKPDE